MLRKLISPGWAVLEYIWYPLLLFIATPWFLRQLGVQEYGHWMLLMATVGFGGVLNSGTGAATIKGVSAGIGRDAADEIGRTVNASLAVAMLGGGVLALLVFSGFWFAASPVFGRMGSAELVRLTGLAAAAVIWLEQLDNVFSSALKGAERFGEAARVEIASKSLQIVAAGLVVYVWPALWSVYSALVIAAVLRLIVKVILARRLLNLPRLRPSFANATSILNFAKWGWIQGIGGLMFSSVDRMLIAALLGANSLTYYSIASQLATQVHGISAASVSVIFPKVSRMREDGRRFSLWRITMLTIVGSFLLSTSLAIVLVLLGPAILQRWIGSESADPTAQLLPWLVIAYWILALNVVLYYILLGLGRIRYIGLTALFSGTVAVIAMYIAISELGLIGAAAGRAVYAVFSLLLVYPLARYLLQGGNTRFDLPLVKTAIGEQGSP